MLHSALTNQYCAKSKLERRFIHSISYSYIIYFTDWLHLSAYKLQIRDYWNINNSIISYSFLLKWNGLLTYSKNFGFSGYLISIIELCWIWKCKLVQHLFPGWNNTLHSVNMLNILQLQFCGIFFLHCLSRDRDLKHKNIISSIDHIIL